jgi:hypothetical protein
MPGKKRIRNGRYALAAAKLGKQPPARGGNAPLSFPAQKGDKRRLRRRLRRAFRRTRRFSKKLFNHLEGFFYGFLLHRLRICLNRIMLCDTSPVFLVPGFCEVAKSHCIIFERDAFLPGRMTIWT